MESMKKVGVLPSIWFYFSPFSCPVHELKHSFFVMIFFILQGGTLPKIQPKFENFVKHGYRVSDSKVQYKFTLQYFIRYPLLTIRSFNKDIFKCKVHGRKISICCFPRCVLPLEGSQVFKVTSSGSDVK